MFLSATIPNAKQFADWICKIHSQICHVVYTDFRPTPLQHYLFPRASDGIFLVVDEKGVFRNENFQQGMAKLGANQVEESPAAAKGRKTKKNRNSNNTGADDISELPN